MAKKNEWTVILLYPDYATGDYGADIYAEWADCKDPHEAVKIVQRKALDANKEHACFENAAPDDFRPIAVIRGHHELELDATNFTGEDQI